MLVKGSGFHPPHSRHVKSDLFSEAHTVIPETEPFQTLLSKVGVIFLVVMINTPTTTARAAGLMHGKMLFYLIFRWNKSVSEVFQKGDNCLSPKRKMQRI